MQLIQTMMKHLYYNNPNDAQCMSIEDEFMLGDLLIAPIVYEGETQRKIYLLEGKWENIFTGQLFDGKIFISQTCEIDEISVFIRSGSAMMLNLDENFSLGHPVGNNVDGFVNPCVYISGASGEYSYQGAGIDCYVKWDNGNVTIKSNSEYEITCVVKI